MPDEVMVMSSNTLWNDFTASFSLPLFLFFILGFISNDDGNGNARKQRFDWMGKYNPAARAARTLVQFIEVVCETTMWNCLNDFPAFAMTARLPVFL